MVLRNVFGKPSEEWLWILCEMDLNDKRAGLLRFANDCSFSIFLLDLTVFMGRPYEHVQHFTVWVIYGYQDLPIRMRCG